MSLTLRTAAAQVHLLIRHDEFLRTFDASIRAQLMEEMGKPEAFVHIHKQSHVVSLVCAMPGAPLTHACI